jgi:hypothetical protein
MKTRRGRPSKPAYKDMTPAQIGKQHEHYARRFLNRSLAKEEDINWICLWVREEVRKAIRRERGLK